MKLTTSSMVMRTLIVSRKFDANEAIDGDDVQYKETMWLTIGV